MKKIIIAIDGYSSSGKSTMAKRLASQIGYRYIDTGAMYRAVTLHALDNGLIDAAGAVNLDRLRDVLNSLSIDFAPQPDGTQHTLLNGADVEREIRTLRVSNQVSTIAAIPFVRHALVAVQQSLGRDKGIVMDGRDIGTTVFPNAELKVFVTASPETRAQRRFSELVDKGMPASYEEVLANVIHRDHIDETREESPLRRADDALLLDNSRISVEEQDKWLMEQYQRVAK